MTNKQKPCYTYSMAFSSKDPKSYLPPDADLEALLRDVMPTVEALIAAVLAGQANADTLIAEAVSGQPELMRIAIVEKIRAAVRERSQAKADALDAALSEQKLLEHHRQKQVWQQWLSHMLRQDTLRKLREALIGSPLLRGEVETIGQKLAREGVLQQKQERTTNQAPDLGDLAANVQQSKGSRQKKDGKGGGL